MTRVRGAAHHKVDTINAGIRAVEDTVDIGGVEVLYKYLILVTVQPNWLRCISLRSVILLKPYYILKSLSCHSYWNLGRTMVHGHT